ncbi:MAG: ribosome maturation factor RimP [Bacillota bacterium]|nr:ribosome maturation factor RimP [Bacillota bacterium]
MSKNGRSVPVTEIVREIIYPIAEKLELKIWDIEYKKEGGMYVLRIFIDKEGGVTVEDCEAMSRAIDAPLDEADPIAESYYLEVSSAGLDRSLKKSEHFEQYIGSRVDVNLYKPQNGIKQYTGVLLSHDDSSVSIEDENGSHTFKMADVSAVRLSVEF